MTTRERKTLTREARKLLESPDLFRKHLDAMQRNGLVGEEPNATIVLVTGVSRLLQKPLNLTVKGPSSAGKNHLIKCVLSLFPKDAVREITSTSVHAWHYSEDDFKHRILYQQELDLKSAAMRQVRQFISEDRLIRTTTVRRNGRFVAERFVAEGPIAAISTTTKLQLAIDEETRHLSLFVDETREQTRRVLDAAFHQTSPLSEEEVKVWKQAHRLLAHRASEATIVFPSWVAAISHAAYDQNIRMRRYMTAFATACESVALIRSFLPGHYDGRKRRIEVHFSDFAVAALLFVPAFEESLHRGKEEETDRTRALVDRLAARTKAKGVGRRDVQKELGISKDKAYRLLRDALDAGAIYRSNKPEKGNAKLYRPTKWPRFIPAPEDLFRQLPEIGNRVRFVHPLTGRKIVYRREKD
jgi:hypothetical protein